MIPSLSTRFPQIVEKKVEKTMIFPSPSSSFMKTCIQGLLILSFIRPCITPILQKDRPFANTVVSNSTSPNLVSFQLKNPKSFAVWSSITQELLQAGDSQKIFNQVLISEIITTPKNITVNKPEDIEKNNLYRDDSYFSNSNTLNSTQIEMTQQKIQTVSETFLKQPSEKESEEIDDSTIKWLANSIGGKMLRMLFCVAFTYYVKSTPKSIWNESPINFFAIVLGKKAVNGQN